MHIRLQKPAVILAALLQVLPLVRTMLVNPATGNTFAFILRWGIGTGAVLGSVDAVSAATSTYTTPSTFSGTVGTAFSQNVTVSIGGGSKAAANDYFFLSAGTVTSTLLMNGQSTTATLPPGLTFTASWVNNATTIGGTLTGTPTAAGTYATTVTVVSPGNATLSQTITLTITGTTTPTAPAITKAPSATNVVAGKTATFTATASGTAPLGYFWLKNNSPLANGGNIAGATTATLTLTTVAAADAANYSVLVSNSVGTATSTAAALTVILPPTITAQPAAQAVASGVSASFSVTATGSAPLAYQWLKNGAAIANGAKYSGVTTSGLTVTAAAAADTGNYSVVITNAAGSVTSAVAPLTIVATPTITTPPANLSVVAGASASFTVTAAGSAPLFYFWLKNNSPLANGGNVSGVSTANLILSTVTTNDAASYSVIVSNSLGTITSTAAALTVSVPPAIVTSPADATRIAGSNVTFTVTASGTAPLVYQWKKNGSAIANGGNVSGANTATLTLANLAAADAASYSATVTNAVGSATSAAAALTVLVPPAITTAPASTSVVQGNPVSFSATAAGTAPLSFQWLKNGAAIAGAVSNLFTLSAVSTNDAGNYSVVVTNIAGSAASSSAALTVLVPPTISTQPAAQAVAGGVSASFSVTATGSAPLAYQWLKNGAAIANGVKYSGVTTSALTVTAVAAADTGNYSVIITNAAGSVTSAVAPLTIVATPTITAPPANLSVVAGANASFTVSAAGSAPLFYFWLKNNSPLTDGGNVSGAGTTNLILSAVTTNETASYSVIVSNSLGTITSPAASLTVSVPPAIITSPADATLIAGSNVSFTVTASGTAPLVYQWKKNGAAIANGGNVSGANTASLTLANLAAADAASYSATVTNAVGSATSAAAALTVLVPPAITTAPASTSVVQGNPVSFSATAAGTAPLSFQWLKNGAAIAGAVSNLFTLSAVSTNDAGNYSVVVTNIAGSAASSSAALTVLVPPTIDTPPADVTALAGSNVSFTVTASGTAPLTYQWKKNSANLAGATAATLSLNNISAADAASYSVVVSNAAGTATSSAAVLTVLLPPAIVTQPANQFGALGSTINLAVVASGTGLLSYQWFQHGIVLADGGNISGSATTNLTITALTTNEVDTYSVVVSNAYGIVTSANANVSINASPIIIMPPASQNVAVSNTATFTVTAAGTGPLAYRWLKNGTPLTNGTLVYGGPTTSIPPSVPPPPWGMPKPPVPPVRPGGGLIIGATVSGTTLPTLALANVSTNDNGNYSVIITNIYGSITSSVAKLAVFTPPAITGHPTNRAVIIGTNVTFAVTATGSGPLNFQWLKNGSPLAEGGNISGSTTNVLKLSGLTAAEAGNYSVTVGNAVGSATSRNATLTMLVPPAITTQPVSQSVTLSNAVTFSISATGTETLRYQWRKAGVAIAGATNATFSLAVAKTTDAANYSVVVTNLAGSVTSSNVTLTVNVKPAFTAQATNRWAKSGTNTVFRATISGTAPFSYQWFKDGVALTDGGNISGSLSNVLTVANLITNDNGAYYLTASNVAGSATSTNAVLTVVVPPAIITQPANQSVTLSNAATFTVAATGTEQLRYQWRKAGVAIVGATNAAFSVAIAKTTDAAAYSVVVTNLAGSVTSSNATLTVNIKPAFTAQAANRWAKSGTNTVFRATISGTAPFSYQWFKDGVALTDGGNISGSLSNVLTVANLITNDSGAYYLTANNVAGSATSTNAVLAVIVPPAIIAQPTNQSVTLSNAVTFTATTSGTEKLFYQWRKAGVAIANATNAAFSLAIAKTTDAAAYSVVVTNLAGSVTSSNATLTVNIKPAFTVQAASRWAKSGTNTVFRAIVSGTAPFSYQWFKDGVALTDGGNISGSFSNVLTVANLTTNDNGAYGLTASNVAGSATSTNASLAVIVPPAIITQPANQGILASNAVTFSVAATGTETLRYQWRKAGVAIANATNFTYTIASAKMTDAAAYSVVVTNLAGSVTSANATLTVWLPPVFTLQAGSRTATNGTTTVFRAAVSGTAPFTYQWLKDGVALTNGGNISGSFSNVLTITNVRTSNAGSYALTVKNPGATVTSSNAVLKVVAKRSSDDDEHNGNTVKANSLPSAGVSAKAIVSAPPVLQISASTSSGVSSKISSPQSASFVLTCTGTPGANYILQATDDLAIWFNVSTNTADASGHCQMSDNTKSNGRFYRLQVAP